MITAEVTLPSPILIEVTLPLSAVGGECAPGIYQNSNNSFEQEIESSETYSAPDIKVTTPKIGNNDIDGGIVPKYLALVPANLDHELPEIEVYSDNTQDPASKRKAKPGVSIFGPFLIVEDENGTELLNVRSLPFLLQDGTIEFKLPVQVVPNITHTDSTGIEVELPAQTPFIATPSFPEQVVPQPLKITNPQSISGSYLSQYSGDLIDVFQTGLFDPSDHSLICPRYRKCDPSNIFRLDPSTPNPFGTIYRYTLLNGAHADINETTWSSESQIPGKEYFVVDWLINWGFYQPNCGIYSPISLAHDEVISLNASSFKGWNDWIMTPMEHIVKSFCPDLTADQSLNNSNFAKKGLISGSNEVWMWCSNYDWDNPTSVLTRSVNGDIARRSLGNSLTALYICRRIQASDYLLYLP